jgi:hypothetical protein
LPAVIGSHPLFYRPTNHRMRKDLAIPERC